MLVDKHDSVETLYYWNYEHTYFIMYIIIEQPILFSFIQPVYENRNVLYDEIDDDWETSMRTMQKGQEIYAEPFSDSDDDDSELYTSMDAVMKHSKLEEEQGDSSLCE